MRPDFAIEVDGQDVTGRINDRLLSLIITDQAGTKSDRLELVVDDRDNLIALPRTGAEVRVWLGYAETGLSDMGLFVVDEVEVSGVPEQITIRARAANMRRRLKEHRTRHFERTTLGAIVRQIAGEHGLKPLIGEELAGIEIRYLGQTEESDMHLLTRLAERYDATFKVAAGRLLFVRRGEGKTASGQALQVRLSRTDLIDWTATIRERPQYAKVRARWHDRGQARPRIEEVETGSQGTATFTLRHEYPDQAQARAAAEAKARQLKRGERSLHLTTTGHPAIVAEADLEITGVRDGVDGTWTIKTATHRLTSQEGYITEVEAEGKSD